jgi:hypothetical protein
MSNRHLQRPGKVQRLLTFPHRIIKRPRKDLENSHRILITSIMDSGKNLIFMPEKKNSVVLDCSSLTTFG